jgi:hypothetical protein
MSRTKVLVTGGPVHRVGPGAGASIGGYAVTVFDSCRSGNVPSLTVAPIRTSTS